MPFFSFGNSHSRITMKSTRNEAVPQMISFPTGRMGFGASAVDVVVSVDPPVWRGRATSYPVAVAWITTTDTSRSFANSSRSSELEKDEDDEPDERERFGERDTEEHRRAGQTGRLGLAGHGLDGLAHHVADADAGADGGKAVGEPGADGG